MAANVEKGMQLALLVAHHNHTLIGKLHYAISARLRQAADMPGIDPHARKDTLLLARVDGGIVIIVAGKRRKKRGNRLSFRTHKAKTSSSWNIRHSPRTTGGASRFHSKHSMGLHLMSIGNT